MAKHSLLTWILRVVFYNQSGAMSVDIKVVWKVYCKQRNLTRNRQRDLSAWTIQEFYVCSWVTLAGEDERLPLVGHPHLTPGPGCWCHGQAVTAPSQATSWPTPKFPLTGCRNTLAPHSGIATTTVNMQGWTRPPDNISSQEVQMYEWWKPFVVLGKVSKISSRPGGEVSPNGMILWLSFLILSFIDG